MSDLIHIPIMDLAVEESANRGDGVWLPKFPPKAVNFNYRQVTGLSEPA